MTFNGPVRDELLGSVTRELDRTRGLNRGTTFVLLEICTDGILDLKHIADAISDSLRAEDSISIHGENLILLTLPEINEADGDAAATRLKRLIAKTFTNKTGHPADVGMFYGVLNVPQRLYAEKPDSVLETLESGLILDRETTEENERAEEEIPEEKTEENDLLFICGDTDLNLSEFLSIIPPHIVPVFLPNDAQESLAMLKKKRNGVLLIGEKLPMDEALYLVNNIRSNRMLHDIYSVD
ncbi:MAG TPA: hypothetical protein EYP57_05645 [Thermodesulfobacteriaceae bacterium]|nr:hypothetical protein [Thermodesulfobacteriaceae bacterium]